MPPRALFGRDAVSTMFHVKQNTTNPCGAMSCKGLTFSGREDSCTGLYVKHGGEKSVLGRGGRECCTGLYVGCTPSCTGLYASCMGKRGSCTLVARQKEEIVWKNGDFLSQGEGLRHGGPFLVSRSSQVERPRAISCPGPTLKTCPRQVFFTLRGGAAAGGDGGSADSAGPPHPSALRAATFPVNGEGKGQGPDTT